MHALLLTLLILGGNRHISGPVCPPVLVPKGRTVAYRQCMDRIHGIYFRIPSNWMPRLSPHDASELWILSFTGTPSAEATVLTLTNSSRDIGAATLGFQHTTEGWYLEGRNGYRGGAAERRSSTWVGLFGETLVGAHNERGYAGEHEVMRGLAASSESPLVLTIEFDPAVPITDVDFLLRDLTFLRVTTP